MFSAGGFTEGITIAGEEAAEAVISFDPNYRQANIGYWEQAGRRLGVYERSDIGQGVKNAGHAMSQITTLSGDSSQSERDTSTTQAPGILESTLLFIQSIFRRNTDILNTANTANAVNTSNESNALANLPTYESGGFTEGLSIAGEAGKEAVISFDPARRQENIGYWAVAGQLLGLDDFSLSEMAENSSVVIYDFSGFNWNPIVHVGEGGSDKEGLLAKLRTHEAEFFDWLEDWLKQREVGKFATSNVIY